MLTTSLWTAPKISEPVCHRRALLSYYTANYEVLGEGEPLVLVPGLAGGRGLLRWLAQGLAQHFQVITYDLRGEDDCFALRSRFGMCDLVDDLAEFLDHLGLESPLVMGVSFGGAVALTFATRYRHRLAGLVVQGANVRFERSLFRQVAGQVLADYPLPPDNPFVNQFFNLLFGSRRTDPQVFEFVTRQCWQTDQSVMAHRFRLAEELDLGDRLNRIRVPTLLMRGSRDLLVSSGGWEELAAGIEGAEAIDLAGAGHLACVTHAEEMAKQARCFAKNASLMTEY